MPGYRRLKRRLQEPPSEIAAALPLCRALALARCRAPLARRNLLEAAVLPAGRAAPPRPRRAPGGRGQAPASLTVAGVRAARAAAAAHSQRLGAERLSAARLGAERPAAARNGRRRPAAPAAARGRLGPPSPRAMTAALALPRRPAPGRRGEGAAAAGAAARPLLSSPSSPGKAAAAAPAVPQGWRPRAAALRQGPGGRALRRAGAGRAVKRRGWSRRRASDGGATISAGFGGKRISRKWEMRVASPFSRGEAEHGAGGSAPGDWGKASCGERQGDTHWSHIAGLSRGRGRSPRCGHHPSCRCVGPMPPCSLTAVLALRFSLIVERNLSTRDLVPSAGLLVLLTSQENMCRMLTALRYGRGSVGSMLEAARCCLSVSLGLWEVRSLYWCRELKYSIELKTWILYMGLLNPGYGRELGWGPLRHMEEPSGELCCRSAAQLPNASESLLICLQ